MIPDVSRESSCVDPFDTGDGVMCQVRIHVVRCPPVTRHRGTLPDNEPGYVRAWRFFIDGVDPRIADLHRRHDHYLAVVGRVGEDFLVTGHTCVEYDLTYCYIVNAGGAKTPPAEHGSVGEGQDGPGLVVIKYLGE